MNQTNKGGRDKINYHFMSSQESSQVGRECTCAHRLMKAWESEVKVEQQASHSYMYKAKQDQPVSCSAFQRSNVQHKVSFEQFQIQRLRT